MTQPNHILSRAILPVIGFLVVLSGPEAAAQPPGSLDAIVKAWKERQDRVKSARFVWIDRQTYTKGAHTQLMRRPGQPVIEIPPRDITVDVPHSMSLDG